LIGYELPWNNLTVINNCHVTLERSQIEALQLRKRLELKVKQSLILKGRPFCELGTVKGDHFTTPVA